MTEVTTIIEQYTATKTQMQQLKTQIHNVYMGLETLDEKLRFVLDHGTEFLGHEMWYCGPQNVRVSLYDALYWERCETKSLDDIIECVVEDLAYDEDDEDADEETESTAFHPLAKNEEEATIFKAILEGTKSRSIVIRDLLDRGIGSARHDW